MPPAKPRLNRPIVVQTALELANRDGLEALSLKTLADHLSIRPPSLFNHLAGLDDLIGALAVQTTTALADHLGTQTIGRSGRDAVHALVQAMVAFLQTHPGGYAAMNRFRRDQVPQVPGLAAAEDHLLSIAQSAVRSLNLAPEPTIHLLRGLRALADGFAHLQTAGGFGLPLPITASLAWLTDRLLDGVISSQS